MKIGDLVKFKPEGKLVKGTLTAVKYYERIRKMTEGNLGIIVHDHGTNVQVAFGERIVLLNKAHLEIINKIKGDEND